MKKHFVLAAVAAGLLSLYGCQPVASPLVGIIFNETKFGNYATTNAAATKEGKACGTTILGWVATGDMSIAAAKAAGGVTNVAHIDYTAKNILGIFAEFCTIVKGS
ncbi:hypothetical protein YTPLAS18_35540 [Nitrospira sp.]|nr:hypothetical protein YTPLAS18_35540 [Nitrospira sp.]